MKIIATIIFLCSLLFIKSYGQNNYQVKKLEFVDKADSKLANNVDFIYSPHSKLKSNCKKTKLKSSCNYQYIYIDSIKMTNGNYYSVLDELMKGRNIEYFTSYNSIDEICFDTECYGCYSKKNKSLILTSTKFKIKKRKPSGNTKTKYYNKSSTDLKDDDENCGITIGSGTNYKVKYSFDQKALLLQIDYGNIINSHSKAEIESSFFELAKNLLVEFSNHEKNQPDNFDWFTSISQSLVEKVFELIPVPQEASLARFGLRQENSFSLLPLNPKIHLRVDHATLYDSRTSNDVIQLQNYIDILKDLIDTANIKNNHKNNIVNIPIDTLDILAAIQTNSCRFQFTGQSILSYTKFQDNNEDVFFKFDPFIGLNFQRIGTTNNFSNSSRRLLSSSIDIDFTQKINKSKYLFLFQKYLKRNNSSSSIGEDDEYYQCCRQDPNRCNSLIFFRSDLELLNSDFNECDSIKNYAIFGERSPIVPLILIEVNNNKIFIPFGYTVFDLISNGYMKGKHKIRRAFDKSVVKLKSSNSKTILLPGDIIKTK